MSLGQIHLFSELACWRGTYSPAEWALDTLGGMPMASQVQAGLGGKGFLQHKAGEGWAPPRQGPEEEGAL